LNATPGLWNWAGSVAGIVQQVTIDASVGLWNWIGTGATFVNEQSPAIVPAGHGSRLERKRRIAIEAFGHIHYFETEEEAEKWLHDQLPKQKKQAKQAARRIIREIGPEVAENGLSQAISTYEPVRVISGSQALKAAVALRDQVLARKFDATAYNAAPRNSPRYKKYSTKKKQSQFS
jgi:hypothetical protein